MSDAKNNTSESLKRGGISDLSLLRTLVVVIHQNPWDPCFWEKDNSLVLLAQACLAASKTILQPLLANLNFTIDANNLFYWSKQNKWFLWAMAAAQTTGNHGEK